jgi:leucyl aminopeptidase
MKIEVKAAELGEVEADLLALALAEDGTLPPDLAEAPGAGDAKGSPKRLSPVFPAGGLRVVAVGVGKADDLSAERLRVAAALVAKEAAKLEATALAWVLPAGIDAAVAAEAIVTGTVLGPYRYDRFLASDPDDPAPPAIASLTLVGPEEAEPSAQAAAVVAAAVNRARDLQSTPANFATPTFLGERAEEIAAAHDSVTAEVLGPAELAEKKMGGIIAVSQGGPQEPRLIVLRYRGGGSGPTLGLVGKAVTFDTGGISLKPGAGMHEMKYDMSGGATVLETVAAIAELGLPVDVIAVVPSTENMPSGSAIKPGDVITQYNGTTVEVNNTDAEGRLILADALAYAIELGAERVVDLATLTGAVLIALGSTYAAVIANDDELAAAVSAAGEETGELVWRLPLHPEYKAIMKGTVADLSNLGSKRQAGTITAGSFLEEFVGDTPWAHIDIAGTAWDVGREYTGKDASGYGVRLLVALARDIG